MKKIAVITGFGGINSAGRSSGFQGFKRLVIDALPQNQQLDTLNSLAQLMGLEQHQELSSPTSLAWKQHILTHSLVRGWDNIDWDANAIPFHESFTDDTGTPCWRLSHKRLSVQSAGQLPQGFNPATTYKSLHHPRGLQMAIYGISDALGQLGVDWQQLSQQVNPDQISVYAGSAMAQLDSQGHGGMLQAALLGKRVSAKQCALGLGEMTADFINAYVLGNVGNTGSMTGACASFLYNLKLAVQDIESGRARIAIVGASEAPLRPEVIDGYNSMTALANEQNLRNLDNLNDEHTPDYQRASRPFGQNVGFTLAESAQFIILTDSDLALEQGLTIYAGVGEVFAQADGFKKSIANPGIGNYFTLAKAMASAKRLLGEDALQHSYVHAHGSSTPGNRTTESEIFSQLATTFNIQNWDITAVKAHLGHSIGCAAGDQIINALGTWQYGIIPGITTTQKIADDVHTESLNFLLTHKKISSDEKQLTFINAKGFGGNNASAFLISPNKTQELLQQQVSAEAWQSYLKRNAAVAINAKLWDEQTTAGLTQPIYHFGEQVLQPSDLTLSSSSIQITGWPHAIAL